MKLINAAVFILLLWLPKAGVGQRSLGIDWRPKTISRARQDLTAFAKLGIRYLQIHRSLPQKTWKQIDSLNFSVWARLPVNFAIAQSIAQIDSVSLRHMQKLAAGWEAHSAVKAIGIFAHGNENNARFITAIQYFTAALSSEITKPLYYVSVQASAPLISRTFAFKLVETPAGLSMPSGAVGGFLFEPAAPNRWSKSALKKLLDQTAAKPHLPVFFPSGWLKKMLCKHPALSKSLRLYTQTATPAFPLSPPESVVDKQGSLAAGLLLLLWIIFALTYNYSPLYRKSFLRYLTAHSFYVDDVMQRHIRGYSIGFSILWQHAMAGGIASYCFVAGILSPLARKAVVAHYPNVGLLGQGALAFFLWGFLIIFLLENLSVLWLWLAAPKLINLNQVINLYPWILQLNLVITTLMVAFYLSKQAAVFIYLAAAIFILILLGGFVVSCFDITGCLPLNHRNRYLAGTLGVFILLSGGLTTWIALSPKLLGVVHLALALS